MVVYNMRLGMPMRNILERQREAKNGYGLRVA